MGFKRKEKQAIKKSLLQVTSLKAKKNALKKHMAQAQEEALLEEKALADKYPGVAHTELQNAQTRTSVKKTEYKRAQQKALAAGHANKAAEDAFESALKAA